ncbi:hypothetical protein, partial [Robiginitalea biformata]|uniref:hypothetical protein n=1 Tax=Robiginitalea biformata TaxID=252307 RepID=UPI003D331FE5
VVRVPQGKVDGTNFHRWETADVGRHKPGAEFLEGRSPQNGQDMVFIKGLVVGHRELKEVDEPLEYVDVGDPTGRAA